MAVSPVLRAAFGYLFLVLMTRVAGRRPGKQLTPFEFILIFYLGGLTLTGVVGDETSLTNAVGQILTVALCHYILSWLRFRSDTAMRLLDGVPLVLMEGQRWREETLVRMGLQDDDVMDMARETSIRDLSGIRIAVLETFGSISVLPTSSGPSDTRDQDNHG